MVTIDKANVQSTYTGKPGCACGCRGNHRTKGINPRSVRSTLAQMNKLIAEGGHKVSIGPELVSVQTDTRLYIAYFTA
jgi:hypothetical protein